MVRRLDTGDMILDIIKIILVLIVGGIVIGTLLKLL